VSNKQNHHLTEDRIIRAVVDESELSVANRRHLDTCSRCRTQKAYLEQNLARLGQAARQFAPVPRKGMNLEVPRTSRGIRRSWNWKAVLATTLAATLVCILMWGAFQGGEIFEGTNEETISANDIQSSESLMWQVGILTEYALPPEYLDIAAETEPLINEEFINFMAPLVEDDSLSYIPGEKGVWLC
jgi:hypothetical protein